MPEENEIEISRHGDGWRWSVRSGLDGREWASGILESAKEAQEVALVASAWFSNMSDEG